MLFSRDDGEGMKKLIAGFRNQFMLSRVLVLGRIGCWSVFRLTIGITSGQFVGVFFAHLRFSVPKPLDSNFAYVSWPAVQRTTTSVCNQATLHLFLQIERIF
jgi:hypothetical protein